MNKPLPFVVPKRLAVSECVACHTVRPTEKLVACICGSSICDCGNECPDCVELFQLYVASLADYQARNIHLLDEDNPRDLKWLGANQKKMLQAFKYLGWLNPSIP
jgi:hypothetical protein